MHGYCISHISADTRRFMILIYYGVYIVHLKLNPAYEL